MQTIISNPVLVETTLRVCFRKVAFILLFLLSSNAVGVEIPDHAIKPQDLIERAMSRMDEILVSEWIKNQPLLAYRVPEDVSEIPSIIFNNVGTIDQIQKYNPEVESIEGFFIKHAGKYLNLAVTEKDGVLLLDIYNIGNWGQLTKPVAASKAFEDNPDLIEKLQSFPELADFIHPENSNLMGGVKEAVVHFISLEDLGFSRDEELVLDKSGDWGPGKVQIAKVGDDAYATFEIKRLEDGTTQIKTYIVNTEKSLLPDGAISERPIAYVPAPEARILTSENNQTPMVHACEAELLGIGKVGLLPSEKTKSLRDLINQGS